MTHSDLDIETATGAHLDELCKVPMRPVGMTDEDLRTIVTAPLAMWRELSTARATVRVQAQAIKELDAANKAQAAILSDHARLILTLKTEVGFWQANEALARKSYNELLVQIQMILKPPIAPGTDGVT